MECPLACIPLNSMRWVDEKGHEADRFIVLRKTAGETGVGIA
jgi:hypothetical protein